MSEHDTPRPTTPTPAPPAVQTRAELAPEDPSDLASTADPLVAHALARLADDEHERRARAGEELGDLHWAALHRRILAAVDVARAEGSDRTARPDRATARPRHRRALWSTLLASTAAAAAAWLFLAPPTLRPDSTPGHIGGTTTSSTVAPPAATPEVADLLMAMVDPFLGLEALDDAALTALHAELVTDGAREEADDDTLLGEGLSASSSESLAFLDGAALTALHGSWRAFRQDD